MKHASTTPRQSIQLRGRVSASKPSELWSTLISPGAAPFTLTSPRAVSPSAFGAAAGTSFAAEPPLGPTANNSGVINFETKLGRRRRYELREKARRYADRTLVPRKGVEPVVIHRDYFLDDGEQLDEVSDELALFPAEDRTLACGIRSRRPHGGAHIVMGDGKAGLSGVQSCGSVWSCAVCSGKIQRYRAAELGSVAAWARREGHTLAMVTLTVRHKRSQPLRTRERVDERTGEVFTDFGVWDSVSAGWAAVTSGKEWGSESEEKYSERLAAWRDAYGMWMLGLGRAPRGARGGLEPLRRVGAAESNGVLGWARAVEVTDGANGWHVHIHALVVIDARDRIAGAAAARRLGAGMFERWQRGIGSLGFDADPDNGGLNVTVSYAAERKLAEYLAKDGLDLDSDRGREIKACVESNGRAIAREAVMSTDKTKGRTPFRVLQLIDFDKNSDAAKIGLARWREWVVGSRGRQQLTWSKSLRVLAGIAEDELSDAEVAARNDPGTPVLFMPREAWKVLRHTVIDVIESVELNGAAFVVAELALCGVVVVEVVEPVDLVDDTDLGPFTREVVLDFFAA